MIPPLIKELGIMLAVATVLLVLDRVFRLGPLLRGDLWSTEGLQTGGGLINGTTSRIGMRCGTDIGGCDKDHTCANGFCIKNAPPALREKYPLPVLPTQSK